MTNDAPISPATRRWPVGDFLMGTSGLDTPAFVYDIEGLVGTSRRIAAIADAIACTPLFSLKSLTIADVLDRMVPPLGGAATSSLFEARFARDILGDRAAIHLTTPGLRAEEVAEIAELCDCVSFNSLSQLHRFGDIVRERARIGLRVNPQMSYIPDPRYDPCRRFSKLGTPLGQLAAPEPQDLDAMQSLSGLHVHSNCDSSRFEDLQATVAAVCDKAGHLFERLEWFNLGGGYLFTDEQAPAPLAATVLLLRERYGLEVFVEPGAALVRDCGYVVTTVIDLFESDGKHIAILDTSVNHMPEVFEYQFEPDVVGDSEDGEFEYILAGSSCLAGDVFGEYGFDYPLRVGTRVVFPEAGAYTLVKSHAFNGIKLPTIYALTNDNDLVLLREFTYEDFARQGGEVFHATTGYGDRHTGRVRAS